MQISSPGQQARALVAGGRASEALLLLDRLAAGGDAEALFVLALWTVEGRLLARDLPRARELFRRAGERGHQDGARVYSAFLANGTGGPAGWEEATGILEQWCERDPIAARQRALLAAMDLTAQGDPARSFEGEVLSEAPYVARFPGLFSAEECRFLIELAEPRFRPAAIFHEGKQRFVEDPIRNSDAAGFTLLLEAPAIHALNRRIAAASRTSVAQGEPLQVLRYGVGQQYRRHLDAIAGLANQRHLTMIVYLNDDYKGGETLFTATGLAVRGRLGDGLLFRNALPDGSPDAASQHAGCPVEHGTKLIASRWIRQRPPDHADQGFGPHEAVRKPASEAIRRD